MEAGGAPYRASRMEAEMACSIGSVTSLLAHGIAVEISPRDMARMPRVERQVPQFGSEPLMSCSAFSPALGELDSISILNLSSEQHAHPEAWPGDAPAA